MEEPARPAGRRTGQRSRLGIAFDVLLVIGLVALVAFPVTARLAARASGLPTPRTTPALPPLQRAPTAPLRQVPEFTTGGATAKAVEAGRLLSDVAAMADALNQADARLFGTADVSPLVRLVTNGDILLNESESPNQIGEPQIPYPFHYPPLDRFLDIVLPGNLDERQSEAANDLAGLLALAAVHFPDSFPNGAPAAYDLLNRARAGDACQPQTNLAFLLSTDENSRDDDTRAEFDRAAADCPGDPTPRYLLAEYQSVRTVGRGNDLPGQPLPDAERRRRAFATARRLEDEFPGSPAGWSAEADTDMRLGYLVEAAQPFTARNWFRRAVPLYRRAMSLSSDPGLAAGAARAEAGLHQDARAVELQRRALRGDGASMPLQVRLIDYLERAHRFAEAASANGRFVEGPSHLPDGRALIAEPPVGVGGEDEGVFDEDGTDPLSLGVAGLQSVMLAVGPGPGGAGGGVLDISFIPTFRPIAGVTGEDRWCREWSLRRDLVLAGRAPEALRGFPAKFTDARTGSTCGGAEGSPMLAGIAELEAGDRTAALARVRGLTFELEQYRGERDPRLGLLEDARQDAWRYAGDLARARSAAEEWLAEDPSAVLALDRLGEIAYLAGGFDDASRRFASAERAAGSPLQRADELLKEGTALEMLHRTGPALRALDAAARAAEPVRTRATKAFDEQTAGQAAYDEYNAQVQAGDTELRAHAYPEALPHYDAARRLERYLPEVPGQRLVRPEVLQNNEALDLIEVGRPAAGLSLATVAVRTDPADPVFLENQGFAQVQLGRLAEGARSYRAALASDPTLYPAANDLGVILAEEGRFDEAETWLRRAIGTEPTYALGRFNLGIVLAHRGPAHLLASQGALGAASAIDSSFRFRNRTLEFDDDSFFTTLDLSKPLPADWRFSHSERRGPVAVAAVVFLLVLIRLGRAVASEVGGGKAQERLLAMSHRRSLLRAALDWRVGPWLAVVATLAVFLWPLAVSRGATLADYMVLGAGVVVLIGVAFRTRALVARGLAVPPRNKTWTPTVAVGVAAAAVGLGFAPMPIAHHEDHPGRLHALPPLVMGAIAVVLLVLGHVTGVPVTRALGAAALVMASSMLTPIEPLDGAFVEGWPVVAGSVALIAIAVLAAVGVL